MQIFARLTKVNEAERTVEGVIANESVDLSGEIFDYDRSKPNFVKWSENIAKATGGKNLGNVRAMHGNVSAGITKAINFDDLVKEITVKAEIVDDNEWKKVQKGCYTGFSIGGRYVGEKWDDPVHKGVKRYEGDPNEYSLVDIPCNSTALFTVVKADGTQEMRKFATTLDNAEALAKWADGLTLNEAQTVLAKIAARSDVSPGEGEHKYGDVKFADEKNKKYPIDTTAHIRAAWNYINKPHNAAKYDAADLKTIKAKIVAAWKDKIDKNGPPSANKDKAEKSAYFDCVASMLIEKKAGESIAKAAGELIGKPLEKGLYTVSELACLLERLNCLADGAQFESEIEGDHSVLPDELREAVKNLSEILVHMVAEEVEEMNAGDDVEVIALSDKGNLTKALTNGDDPMNAELQKKFDESQAALVKMTGERDELQKVLDTAATSIKERDELLTKAAAALEERNAIIEKFNNAPQPVKAALMSVSKSADSVNAVEIEPVRNQDGTVDQAATEIKKALMNPVVRR